jgi:TetR/AcrR family transcriptional regulator, cholesterol catabolism regulator
VKRTRKPRPETARKRLQILDAAARAIARRGFHGMSMRELAAETGQVVAGFYNYFASKDEVLFRIQESAFENLIAAADEALRDVSAPPDRLFAFIYQHVRYVADHPDVMRVLVHEAGTLQARERARVRTLKERYYDIGRAIVAELYRDGDAGEQERLTYGIFGMLNWVYGWYQPSRHGSPGEVARSLQRLALAGLTGEWRARGSADIERRLSIVAPLPLLRREKP